MISYVHQSDAFSIVGKLAVRRSRRAFIVPERSRLVLQPATRVHLRGHLRLRQNSIGPICVAGLVGPPSEERSSEERFVDVSAILREFNPLNENHLLVWEDSDDEDGSVQAELPQSGAWEDSSNGYQGLEYQPSWVDYRDGSESDDSERLQGAAGAYNPLAAVMREVGEDEGTQAKRPLHTSDGSPAGAPAPSAYSPEAGFQEISVLELEERLATGQFSLLLDVRSPQEYDRGHIAGASNVPIDPDLSTAVRSGSLDEFRNRPVAVVCGSGMRSGQATVRLTKVYGFSNVTNVTGGMMAWIQEGLPVEAAQQPRVGGCCGCGGGGSDGGGCKNK